MSDYKITREEYEDAQNVVWDYEEQLKAEANGAEQCTAPALHIQNVMPSVYGIFKHGTDKAYGYYWDIDVAEEVCAEMNGEDYYVDELCVDQH